MTARKNGLGSCPETGWRRAGTGRRPVRRRACSPFMAARPRCPNAMSPAAVVSAGDHRLLSQRLSGPAVLCGRTADRPWAFGGVTQDIVPRLLRMFPATTVKELKAPLSGTFVILFDREGYSRSLQGDVANPPHRLLHLPQVSQNDRPAAEFAEIERRCRAASESRCNWLSGERGSATEERSWVRELRS